MTKQYFKIYLLCAIVIWCYFLMEVTVSKPQTNNLLILACSSYKVSSLSNFNSNLNATYKALRAQLNNSNHFATAEALSGSDGVYAMFQCRDYMSTADCVACFTAATIELRNCSSGSDNGGRVVYDGCLLRYERNDFYGESTTDANREHCSNRTTSSPATAFQPAVEGLLAELQVATPRIKGFYAASKKQVVGANNLTIYGIAQCVQTIDIMGCQACLVVAYRNLVRCVPNGDGSAVDSGCYMRYSDKPFFADNQTTNLKPFLKANGSSTKKTLIIGVAAGGVGLILLIIALFIWYTIITKSKQSLRGDILGATELRGPVSYSYKDLKSATKNFIEENKLGEGGFGDVYKGTLKNGKLVAVKKLALSQSRRAKEDFVSEVTLISNVHHRNLVRLLGCCSKGPELLLVYEYMSNSSLDRCLFGNKRGSLNWKKRFDIILGTAQGLSYLHEQFHVCIIHRDIKPSNILLDDDFQAKIADFGLVRLLPESKSHVSTRFAGTLGYTAPEYAVHGQLSEKVDTYSYGVVVLEIISGSKSTEVIGAEFLLKRAWRLYEEGNHLELMDKSLDPNEFEAEDVKRIIEIALTCTQSSPSLRPTMSEVVVLLKSKSTPRQHQPLTKPPFIESEEWIKIHDKSTSTASSNSNANISNGNANISVSQVSGR